MRRNEGKSSTDHYRLVVRAIAVGIMFILLSSLFGCSYFKGRRRMNLTPFAENMITLAADIQYGLAQKRPIYIRKYLDAPEADTLRIYGNKIRRLVTGAIAYSIEVVTLSDSPMSGKKKSKALADYLDELVSPVFETPKPKLRMTRADFDTMITNVRSQSGLLDALGAAQPLISEVARASGELTDQTKDILDIFIIASQAKMDEDNRSVIETDKSLRASQIETVQAVELLRAYRLGDESALETLAATEPRIREMVKSGRKLTEKDLRAIEEQLIFKMTAISRVREQLSPDIKHYWEMQREMDELNAAYNTALRKARIAVITWDRAHQRLAAGITDPAQIDVLGIARKAAKSVI